MNKIPIAVVGGATASGKTGLAVELALALGGEVVSADSMQIYKYMDIGSAKPGIEEMRGVPHHMLDVVLPTQNFSVAEYAAAAHECIAGIASRGHLPIVCGGTGLYIESLIRDVDFGEQDTDEALRAELFEYAAENGNGALHDILAQCDPEAAAAIHENNVKRVVRAVEFFRTTGEKISVHQRMTRQKQSRYTYVLIGIDHDRGALYERINKRVDIMLETGLVTEVERLLGMGVKRENTSMQAIGYKEIAAYLYGECTLDEATEAVKLGSRRYAKRQLTWFRRYEDMKNLPYGCNLINEAVCAVKRGLEV